MTVSERSVIITPDTFFERLGIGWVEPELHGEDAARKAYSLIISYLQSRELATPLDVPPSTNEELPFKIPGVPFTVRLTDATDAEIGLIGVVIAFLMGADAHWEEATPLGFLEIMRRVRRLRSEYGELSVFEALREAPRPTTRDAALQLYGKPCRQRNPQCQFYDTAGACAITLSAVEKIINALVHARVLRQLNAAPPFEYGVVL